MEVASGGRGRKVKLEPLTQWICDRCGQVVKSPEDDLLCWLHKTREGEFKAHGFLIVHIG